MTIILKANKVNLFVSSVLFVFWYHLPNFLDTPHICDVSRLRAKAMRRPLPLELQFAAVHILTAVRSMLSTQIWLDLCHGTDLVLEIFWHCQFYIGVTIIYRNRIYVL
jgi:hypothetical protein